MSRGGRTLLAVIGGSGFDQYPELENTETVTLDTPYGKAAPLTIGELAGGSLAFMPRHGPEHKVPPHLVNYRANVWALRERGVERVLAVNAVGGIRPDLSPGRLVVPDQIVDYTHGREHTYFTGGEAGIVHSEFGEPYNESWRYTVLDRAARRLDLVDGGVYGCTQGPRLETVAEVRRLKNDGCDMVGMTGMPEAALARELDLPYAAVGMVVNWAAGVEAKPITLETVFAQLRVSVQDVKALIATLQGV